MCIAGFSQSMFTTVERVQGLVYELLYEKNHDIWALPQQI